MIVENGRNIVCPKSDTVSASKAIEHRNGRGASIKFWPLEKEEKGQTIAFHCTNIQTSKRLTVSSLAAWNKTRQQAISIAQIARNGRTGVHMHPHTKEHPSVEGECTRCVKSKKDKSVGVRKLAGENTMDPFPNGYPHHLPKLRPIEEALISRTHTL